MVRASTDKMTQSRHQTWSPVDGLSRRSLLRLGVGGLGLSLTGLLQARATRETHRILWAASAQGLRDRVLLRRSEPLGHLRPEAGCPGRSAWRIQADLDFRARLVRVRASAEDGSLHAQGGAHSQHASPEPVARFGIDRGADGPASADGRSRGVRSDQASVPVLWRVAELLATRIAARRAACRAALRLSQRH